MFFDTMEHKELTIVVEIAQSGLFHDAKIGKNERVAKEKAKEY